MDIVQAFEPNDEMNYSFDLRQILSTMKINETNPKEEENALVLKNPNNLLLQQRDRGLDNSRTWWGLQMTDTTNEEKEKNPIAELKEGKSGIASGYTNEKF
jgi:hypothetical protein